MFPACSILATTTELAESLGPMTAAIGRVETFTRHEPKTCSSGVVALDTSPRSVGVLSVTKENAMAFALEGIPQVSKIR